MPHMFKKNHGGVKHIRLVTMTCPCAGEDDNSNVAFVDWLNNSHSRLAETIATQNVTKPLFLRRVVQLVLVHPAASPDLSCHSFQDGIGIQKHCFRQ